jgi:hypothetical protein
MRRYVQKIAKKHHFRICPKTDPLPVSIPTAEQEHPPPLSEPIPAAPASITVLSSGESE